MEHKFVTGTDKLPDYLVIAYSGRCVASIKPLITATGGKLVLCLRVRVSASPTANIDTIPMTATEIAQAFPKLALKNTDNVRGSIQFVFPIGPAATKTFVGAEKMISNKKALTLFTSALRDKDLPLCGTDKEITDWMYTILSRQVQIAKSKSGPSVNKAAIENAVAEQLTLLFKNSGSSTPK